MALAILKKESRKFDLKSIREAITSGMLFRSLLLLLLAGVPLWCIAQPAVATDCGTVLRMSSAEANAGSPVQLKGVITCYFPNSQLCFVQDETAGIYVFPAQWPLELRIGDEVEVAGVTAAGRFSPIVRNARIRKTGRELPLPSRRASVAEVNTGELDAQMIELRGVVQVQFNTADATQLELWSGNSFTRAIIFGGAISGTNFVDARVTVRGVAGTFYREGQLSGFGVFLNGINAVQVEEPASDPFTSPERSLGKPLIFGSSNQTERRIRVKGTVAAHWPGEALFLQDDTGAMLVQGAIEEQLRVGERVEASGFLRGTPDNWWLAEAMTRKIDGTTAIAVRESGESTPASARTSVVAAEGRVLASTASAGRGLVTLEIRGTPIAVFAPEDFGYLKAGSQVRVTGVWHSPPKVWQPNSGPGIWLHSPESLVITARPKLELVRNNESERSAWSAAIVSACAAALLGGIVVRRNIQLRTEAERGRTARAQLSDAATELQRQSEARERLGRDLHDHIIQSVYALGLSLDDSARQVRENPEQVESRLKRALGEVNSVIRELRNVILGLETNAIEPREFRTALKSLSLALGNEKSSRTRLEIDQSAMEALTPLQATELIHIAREGLSNSLRHGHAETTTFALHRRDESVRFSIEDDGVGFEPNAPGRSGFGLRNMAKRAENLGATFTIEARPGAGTRIVLDIPRQKQHFSHSESSSRSHR